MSDIHLFNHIVPANDQKHISLDALQNETHVWYASKISNVSQGKLKRLFEILSEEEKSRAKRFHFEKDRALYILAHGLLRTSLSRYYDIIPSEWCFEYDDKGKPFITNNINSLPEFNLTHSGGLTACVITLNNACGIDVEMTNRLDAPEQMLEAVCSQEELDELSLYSDGGLIRKKFYQYWVLKEAYIKAIGYGLSFGVERLTFKITSSTDITLSIDGKNQPDWQFELHQPCDEWVLATAVSSLSEKRMDPRYVMVELGKPNTS